MDRSIQQARGTRQQGKIGGRVDNNARGAGSIITENNWVQLMNSFDRPSSTLCKIMGSELLRSSLRELRALNKAIYCVTMCDFYQAHDYHLLLELCEMENRMRL